jgi:predicted Zn-dependent peptidase
MKMWQPAKKHLYPNGLTLIVDEAPELKSISIGAWVKTGSRHEAQDYWGVCHFLEHMIFKGGKKRGALDISKAVDRVGGDFNAFTSREHTCFHFYLPAMEVRLGVSLLREILFSPLFAAKEIERERQVILQEIAMTRESPEEDTFDRFMEKVFGKHPIGRNILGSKESIRGLSRKKVCDFFNQHYRPENMVIAVSGNLSFEKAKREFLPLGKSPWPERKKDAQVIPQWGMEPPGPTVPGFWWVDEKSEQAHVIYTLNAPLKSHKDRVVSTVLQQYLGGGMSSVLFDKIREKKGWAYTVYASAIQFLDASLFTLYAGVKSEKVIDTLKVFHSEMAKVALTGVPRADLKRIQDSLVYSYDLSMENSESRMMTISSSELFFKREVSSREYQRMIRSITVADTLKVVARWVAESKPSVLVLSPKPKKVGAWSGVKKYAVKLTGNAICLEDFS